MAARSLTNINSDGAGRAQSAATMLPSQPCLQNQARKKQDPGSTLAGPAASMACWLRAPQACRKPGGRRCQQIIALSGPACQQRSAGAGTLGIAYQMGGPTGAPTEAAGRQNVKSAGRATPQGRLRSRCRQGPALWGAGSKAPTPTQGATAGGQGDRLCRAAPQGWPWAAADATRSLGQSRATGAAAGRPQGGRVATAGHEEEAGRMPAPLLHCLCCLGEGHVHGPAQGLSAPRRVCLTCRVPPGAAELLVPGSALAPAASALSQAHTGGARPWPDPRSHQAGAGLVVVVCRAAAAPSQPACTGAAAMQQKCHGPRASGTRGGGSVQHGRSNRLQARGEGAREPAHPHHQGPDRGAAGAAPC